MKKNKTFLIFGIAMVIVAICFIIYALNNPQAGFPWSNEANEKWDRRPMVMVKDEIYMDTGKQIAEEIEESAILGTITSSVDGTEKPTQNGESNFGCEGAQYAFYDDGLVVMLQNEWVFFEKEKD